jgi:hypothetical protein
VRAAVQKTSNFVAVLDLVLNVHLATLPVLVLPAECLIVPTDSAPLSQIFYQ